MANRYTPRTPVTAAAELSRRLGSQERAKSAASSGAGGSPPAALAYNSVNQSIANNTLTMLALDTERFDTDGIHDNATNNTRLTCQTAGKYAVFSSMIWAFNGTGVRVMQILLNGTTGFIWSSQNAVSIAITNETTRMTCSGLIDLVVGDYIEAQVKQTSGGALDSVAVTVPSGLAPVLGMVKLF